MVVADQNRKAVVLTAPPTRLGLTIAASGFVTPGKNHHILHTITN